MIQFRRLKSIMSHLILPVTVWKRLVSESFKTFLRLLVRFPTQNSKAMDVKLNRAVLLPGRSVV